MRFDRLYGYDGYLGKNNNHRIEVVSFLADEGSVIFSALKNLNFPLNAGLGVALNCYTDRDQKLRQTVDKIKAGNLDAAFELLKDEGEGIYKLPDGPRAKLHLGLKSVSNRGSSITPNELPVGEFVVNGYPLFKDEMRVFEPTILETPVARAGQLYSLIPED